MGGSIKKIVKVASLGTIDMGDEAPPEQEAQASGPEADTGPTAEEKEQAGKRRRTRANLGGRGSTVLSGKTTSSLG